MSLLSDFGSRIAPTIAAVLPASWDDKLAAIESSTPAIQDRRDKLVAEQEALAMDAALGDPAAVKRVDQLERNIADLDRQLARNHKASEQAAGKIQARNLAALRARNAQQREGLRQDIAEHRRLAEEADAMLAALVMKLNELRAAGEHLRLKTGANEVGFAVSDFHQAVPHVIAYKLASSGWPTKCVPLVPERRDIAGWLPDPVWIEQQFVPEAA